MADSFAVELDIRDEATRRLFEATIQQQPGFFVRAEHAAAPPHLVILDMPVDHHDSILYRIPSVQRRAPAAEIFITSYSHNTDDLVEAFRMGVRDFIALPLKPEEPVFAQALNRFLQRHAQAGNAGQTAGKVINLMGSKGGIGTTTLAVNLAMSLKHKDRTKEVVLVDLDVPFGDAALFLDLQPVNTIMHLAQNMTRLDSVFVRSVLSPHTSGVFLLPAPNIDEDTSLLTPETVEQTLELLCATFDYVIIDGGHTLYDITMATMQYISSLFLVSTLQLPVLRNIHRLYTLFDAQEWIDPSHIHLIVNRYKSDYEEVALKDLQKEYPNKILTIPNDYKTMANFIHYGKPIIRRATPFSWLSSRGRMTRKFRHLASDIEAILQT